jgi:hypothetical protein
MLIGNERCGPNRAFVKLFVTWSPDERILRLGRCVWQRGRFQFGPRGNGAYSAKFSWGLTPRLFAWHRGWHEWLLIVCGVRLHYLRSYGGYLC